MQDLPQAIALFDSSWRSTTSTCIGAAIETASKNMIMRAVQNTILDASKRYKNDIRGAINMYRITAMRYGASEERLGAILQLDDRKYSKMKRFQILRQAFDDLFVLLTEEAASENNIEKNQDIEYFLVYHYATEPIFSTDDWRIVPLLPQFTQPLAFSKSRARAPHLCKQWQRYIFDKKELPIVDNHVQVCAVNGNIHVRTTPKPAHYDGVYMQDITIQALRTSASNRPYYRRIRTFTETELTFLDQIKTTNHYSSNSSSPQGGGQESLLSNKRQRMSLTSSNSYSNYGGATSSGSSRIKKTLFFLNFFPPRGRRHRQQ
mmetsp:Transcript_13675/g.18229  ORF Transcript_13675/g.18229 Transcript_13675/m.18229 type:complete len:319 (-) Transcript_13675:188-1144(-)